jgi:hypothetical protein
MVFKKTRYDDGELFNGKGVNGDGLKWH